MERDARKFVGWQLVAVGWRRNNGKAGRVVFAIPPLLAGGARTARANNDRDDEEKHESSDA